MIVGVYQGFAPGLSGGVERVELVYIGGRRWGAPKFARGCTSGVGAAGVYQSYAPGECIWCGAPSHVSPMVVAQRSGGRLAKWQI